MNKLIRFNFLIFLAIWCNTLAASELTASLTGIWKHDEQAVWAKITNQEGIISGVFLQHDVKPELNGKPFIKQFVAETDNQLLWNGLVYAARLKEFKEAEISQDSVDAFVLTATVKVGLLSARWFRIGRVARVYRANSNHRCWRHPY